ncbi:hypothetical protein HDU67_005941, partial [Dinochytrium kinnereticum]
MTSDDLAHALGLTTPLESSSSTPASAPAPSPLKKPVLMNKDDETTAAAAVAAPAAGVSEEPPLKPEEMEELKGQAVTHIAEGKRAFALANFEAAVEEFGAASQILASIYGPDAPECADVLYSYGVALFNNSVSKSSPLGGSVSTTEVAETLKAQLSKPTPPTSTLHRTNVSTSQTASQKDSSRFVFSGDASEEPEKDDPTASGSTASPEKTLRLGDQVEENDEDEVEGEGEEEEDGMAEDMQIAWE